jgi:hypothetical protein
MRKQYTNTKPMSLPRTFTPGFLKDFDKRTELYQLLNTAFQQVMSDMGGEGSLSHVQICLAERFTFLEFTLRAIEHKMAHNPKKADDLFSKWIYGLNALQGLAKTIGLKRKAKRVVDLKLYVDQQKKKRKERTG